MNAFGSAPALAGKRVLVIEDNAENMRLFRAVLQLEGAQILAAERAQSGLEIALSELPDVILMDVQMPGMDGLAAARLLRDDPRTGHIPIIIVTASVMEGDRQKAMQSGCDGYITKPIEPANFGRQVADFIEAARQNRAL